VLWSAAARLSTTSADHVDAHAGDVAGEGRFYTLSGAYLAPKPVQKPHIPIWVPGDSEATRGLAAEIADVWLTYSKPPETVGAWIEDMARRRGGRRLPMAISTVSLAGLPPAEVERCSVLYAKERGHRVAVPPTPADVLNENLWGTPEQCIERVRRYASLGVEHLIIQPIPPLEGMRYFAAEILPAFA
jgi:FMNH2-dependent dimethyl sulfone monooxygenase